MKPEQSKEKLIELIKNKEFKQENLSLGEALSLVLDFYTETRPEDCEINQDGDMLLFQWRHLSEEQKYEVDIVRQFILSDLDADDRMSQLHLTLSFPVSENINLISDGNIWCHLPEDTDDFNKIISNSEIFKSLELALPVAVKINYELV